MNFLFACFRLKHENDKNISKICMKLYFLVVLKFTGNICSSPWTLHKSASSGIFLMSLMTFWPRGSQLTLFIAELHTVCPEGNYCISVCLHYSLSCHPQQV